MLSASSSQPLLNVCVRERDTKRAAARQREAAAETRLRGLSNTAHKLHSLLSAVETYEASGRAQQLAQTGTVLEQSSRQQVALSQDIQVRGSRAEAATKPVGSLGVAVESKPWGHEWRGEQS